MPIRRKPGSIIEREAHPTGDASVTHYEVLQVFTPTGTGSDATDTAPTSESGSGPTGIMGSDPIPTCSLVRFRLETGRTHQIRVHCAAKGHPLLGDTLYGGPAFAPLAGQALVCDRLVFRHPVEGSMVEIRSRRNFPMFQLGFTPPS
jgi:23S rRNA pseudouridine1911/1915/1917 synthase